MPKVTVTTSPPVGEGEAEPQAFIVAEVSKSWPCGDTDSPTILCQRFEAVIATNLKRGYQLHSWKLVSIVHDNRICETIIAVFQLFRQE